MVFWKDRRTEEQKNMVFFKDRRTEEHVLGEKTGEHITPLPMGGRGWGWAFFISQSIQWHMPIFPPYVQ